MSEPWPPPHVPSVDDLLAALAMLSEENQRLRNQLIPTDDVLVPAGRKWWNLDLRQGFDSRDDADRHATLDRFAVVEIGDDTVSVTLVPYGTARPTPT